MGPQISTEKTVKILNSSVWFCVILWLNQVFVLFWLLFLNKNILCVLCGFIFIKKI